MTRSATVLAMCAVICGGALFAAEEDPIGAKLATAKAEYGKSMTKASDGLLAELKKKADTAQKAGDPDVLDKVEKEAKVFEVEGTLPKSVSVIDYMEAQRVARARLGVAYDTAVKDYTMAGKKDLAKATRETWTEIKNEGVAPKALPVKPQPADDGFAVGTEVKATSVVRWGPPGKRETNEGGFMFTVTKRSGNNFTITGGSGWQAEGKVENGTVSYTITISRKQADVGKVSFFGRFNKDKGTLVGRTLSKNDPTWSQEVKGEVVNEK